MRATLPFLILFALSPFAAAQEADVATPTDGAVELPLDNDFVRAAVARGEILPLSELLPRLMEVFPGEVLDIELDRYDDGSFEEYEFEILTPDGRLIEVDMDAVTGHISEVETEYSDDLDDDDDD